MLIRQQAFQQPGRKLLKGGLHCHTTRSDGRMSPEDTIRYHAENGYDFLALTDHRNYNYVNYAPETGVLLIPGMEVDGGFPDVGIHCLHSVCIGPEKDKGNGFEQDERPESVKLTEGWKSFQPLIDEIKRKNNLTFYCHPEWSATPARDFENIEGYFGMEIWNSGCALEDGLDMNAAYWDEILMQGKRWWGVAVDDGHDRPHHCNGWVRVNAEKNVDAVLAALESGAFYSSCGPEIYDFYVEDGVAHVECSPIKEIAFRYGRWPCRILRTEGEPVTHHEFKMPVEFDYIRVTIVDEQGRRAWSNPIFLKD